MFLDWIKSWFKKKPIEPKLIEHRGMKAYFSPEMVEEFENAGIDYEKEFRAAVDEFMEEIEDDEDEDNPYK